MKRCFIRLASNVASVHLPSHMKIGAGVCSSLPQALHRLGASSTLLVTDSFMISSGLISPVTQALTEAEISFKVFDGVVPDPTTDSIAKGVAEAQACDAIVGFGGGSALDSAKAIAVLAVHGGPLSRLKVPAEVPMGLPVVCIPTTAGTGSEVTRVAVITNMGPGMLANTALVDFELSMKKPYRLTADSGLDALCHALEAYVSRKSTLFTDALALTALQRIVEHLPTACEDPTDRFAREGMMLAATEAGIAFSNASVTLIHGMSRPIGAHFHVPHGLSNAMLLPSVTRWSLCGAPHRYADCARAMGFATKSQGDAEALEGLVSGLESLCEQLNVPQLSEVGISKEEVERLAPLMADQALASGSPLNNPRIPSAEDIIDLYHALG